MSAYKPKNTSEEYLLNECRRLEALVQELEASLKEQKQIVNRAKDARPVQRSSFMRVIKLVRSACMDLKRLSDGWLLEFGNLRRKFKRLNQVWDLFTTDDWVLSEIFNPVTPPPKRDRVLVPKPILPARYPSIAPKVANDTEEKIKLLSSSAISLTPALARSLTGFSLEQVSNAADYYKATIAKGREIKSAAGWLIKCLKEEWYKNFVPETPAYTPKIFTAADLPDVEAARFPSDFWEKARSRIQGNDRVQERLDKLVPY